MTVVRYVIAKVLTLDDEELGYVVVKEGTSKLEDSNLWLEGEGIEDHVANLNELTLLREFWPDANDPAVQVLINDPAFEPLEYEVSTLIDAATDEEAQVESLKNPAQPIERYNEACKIVARERAGLNG